MEFDASGDLWVVTYTPASESEETVESGNLYRIGPDMYRDLITKVEALPGGIGLAIPSTSASETQTFTSEDNSQAYDFGDHTFVITTEVQGDLRRDRDRHRDTS